MELIKHFKLFKLFKPSNPPTLLNPPQSLQSPPNLYIPLAALPNDFYISPVNNLNTWDRGNLNEIFIGVCEKAFFHVGLYAISF